MIGFLIVKHDLAHVFLKIENSDRQPLQGGSAPWYSCPEKTHPLEGGPDLMTCF